MRLKILIYRERRIALTILFLMFSNFFFTLAQAAPTESATWRFEFDNDFFVNKDSGFTSGWSIQKHTPIAEHWLELQEVPEFVGRWGENILTLYSDKLSKRAGIAIGQFIQTPFDLSRTDLILDDVPYAGALTVQATWYAFNNDHFRGFQMTIGIIGPASLAETSQDFIHRLTNSEEPNGWGNQLSNEPIINVNVMVKKKLWQINSANLYSFDATVSTNIALGNMFTHALASVEMRYGYNMPGGFVNVPDPIGYSMQYIAALAPANPDDSSLYGSLVVRAAVIAHNIFLDGSLFNDSHSVEKEPLVAHLIAGLHYERPDWSIHFNMFFATDTVDDHQITSAESNEMFGNVIVEWLF